MSYPKKSVGVWTSEWVRSALPSSHRFAFGKTGEVRALLGKAEQEGCAS